MSRQAPVGVEAHLARAKLQTRLANVVDLLHLLRRYLLANPQELPFAGEVLQKIHGFQFREDLLKFARGTGWIHHLWRLRIERMCPDIGRQKSPLAVDDIGPLRHDTCGRD